MTPRLDNGLGREGIATQRSTQLFITWDLDQCVFYALWTFSLVTFLALIISMIVLHLLLSLPGEIGRGISLLNPPKRVRGHWVFRARAVRCQFHRL
jgi:membrane protein required for beta-lactamase induction